jgi:hypothetical protein
LRWLFQAFLSKERCVALVDLLDVVLEPLAQERHELDRHAERARLEGVLELGDLLGELRVFFLVRSLPRGKRMGAQVGLSGECVSYTVAL